MDTLRLKALAITAGAAAPLAFAPGAQADTSTCDWWVDARPLCMVIEGSVDKAVIKNFGASPKTVRFVAINNSSGGSAWRGESIGISGNSTLTACYRPDGMSIFTQPWFGRPCHTWPASGFSIRLEEFSGGAWRPSSAGDIRIGSK